MTIRLPGKLKLSINFWPVIVLFLRDWDFDPNDQRDDTVLLIFGLTFGHFVFMDNLSSGWQIAIRFWPKRIKEGQSWFQYHLTWGVKAVV